jgi:hypothetical protein
MRREVLVKYCAEISLGLQKSRKLAEAKVERFEAGTAWSQEEARSVFGRNSLLSFS